jgi:bifunctional non-homologous end joining protein LigD
MLTRKGLDWTVRFHPIADALARLKALNAYVDGEIAVVGEDGVTSFAELQAVLSDGPASRLVYYAFDLLHVDGRDLMPLPLVQRKQALGSLLARLPKGSPVGSAPRCAHRTPCPSSIHRGSSSPFPNGAGPCSAA